MLLGEGQIDIGVVRCFAPCGGPPVGQLLWIPSPCVCTATGFGQPFVQPITGQQAQPAAAAAPRR